MQNGPKILTTNLTEDAKEWLFKLEEALKNEDYIELSGLAFDATCEDEIENQIDIDWYENKAAQMLNQSQL